MIRTRFAPSPTGYAHVGSIRTALFAFLVARAAGGQFVLRLEDTDKKREVAGSDEHLFRSLHALGLDYDEGPDIGGPFGPYRQSQRLDIYKKWAEQLIAAGRAYADPYSPEEVQKFREQAEKSGRPFHFRDHRPTAPITGGQAPEIGAGQADWYGKVPLRFRSDPKPYRWHDAVMGDLSAGADAIDDFILIKSDGYPTYNFAHIVDDAEMKISHIIRGQEFISSTPNYLNLYEALGLEQPIFATMPHILNETGNKKLGKRDGAKDVLEYFREGFLQEALVNFIASLGWNDGTEQEIFSVAELIAKFSLDRVGHSGARFDEKRLVWLNGQWIKRLSLEELYSRTTSLRGFSRSNPEAESTGLPRATGDARNDESGNFWGENGQKADPERQKEILAVVADRLKTLADLPTLTEYFFTRPQPNWTMVDDNKQLGKLPRQDLIDLLKITREKLAKLSDDDFNNCHPEPATCHSELAEESSKKCHSGEPLVLNSLQDVSESSLSLPEEKQEKLKIPESGSGQALKQDPSTLLGTTKSVQDDKNKNPRGFQNDKIDILQKTLNDLLTETNQKPPILFGLIRFALTWAPFSPGLPETMALLGRDETLARLDTAIETA